MAPKKRHSTSLSGVPPSAPPTSAVADPDGAVNQKHEAMDHSFRNDCMRAFSAHRRGNPAKASKLFKEILLRYPNYGSAHTLVSKFYMNLYLDVKDPTLQQDYLKNALDASRRAVSLLPGSVICAMLHAKLLFKIAKDAEGLDEAVRECHRGLNIKFPEGECKDPADRAANNSIRKLLENIQDSRSNPGKTLSDEFWNDCDLDLEAYFRETMEDKTSEVKKIMDQLTDINGLDQTLSPSTIMEHMDFDRSSRLYRMEEKRKLARLKKVLLSASKITQTRSYWNTISVEEKQDFLKNRIEDMHTHLSSLKDKLPLKVFSAAVQFAMDNKSWKYWECFECLEKFVNWDLLEHHLWEKHLHTIPSKVLQAVPQDLDKAWIDKLLNCPWKPIDTQKALKMMELESKGSSLLSEECSVDRNNAGIEKSGNCEFSVIGSVRDTYMQPAETPVLGKGESSVIDCDDRDWPFSDDANRAQILGRVKILFLSLLNKNYLSFQLFCWILRIGVQQLESVIPRALISKFSLYKSPLSICFLETSMLGQVLDSLAKLADCFFCEEDDTTDDATDDAKLPARERVVFSRDFSSLVLDKRLMAMDQDNMSDKDAVEDDGCAVMSETDDHEHEAASESVDFVKFLLSRTTIEDNTTFWTSMVEEKMRQTLQTHEIYTIRVGELQDIWKEVDRQSCRTRAISKTRFLLHKGMFLDIDLESILSKRRQELGKAAPSEMGSAESSVINELLIHGFRQSEEIDQSSIAIRNRSIRETLEKMASGLSAESSITEGKRRRATFEVDKLELQLRSLTGHDYRDFIFPILTFFSRMRLEDQVLRKATEKSEAAREALLAELEHHEQTSVRKKEENKGKKPKKSKQKKKKNISGAKASKELPEAEEHQNPVPQNLPSATEIQGPPMDMMEDAVLGSAVDIQFEQIHLSDSSENTDGVIADNLAAGTAPGATEMNFDGNMVGSSELDIPINAKTSAPKREESKGKRPKKSKNKKKKKQFSGIKASKEFPFMEEHQHPAKQNPVDRSEVGKSEEAVLGTDIDESQEDVRQLENQFKQLEMPDSDAEADAVVADDTAVEAQSGLEMSRDPPEATGMNFDGNLISNYELGMPSDANRSLSKREENKGKNFKKRQMMNRNKNLVKRNYDENSRKTWKIKSSEYKQIQMSDVSDTADILAAGMRLNDNDNEMNIERNVTSSSDLGKPINDRNDPQIRAKTYADHPEFNKQRKPYDTALGLSNDDRKFYCLLKVIMQSLRHLSTFQDELAKISSVHGHTGDPCIICSLPDIFTHLRKEAKKKSNRAVDLSPLKHALSSFCAERYLPQKERTMDDLEVLESIFYCFHTSALDERKINILREDRDTSGSGDSKSCDCLAHRLFMTDVAENMRCRRCDLLSRFCHYSYCFHFVDAKKLMDMKIFHWSRSFSELVKLAGMDRPPVRCELEVLGCGELNHLSCSIRNLPRYIIVVLCWQTNEENRENIRATLATLAADLDLSLLYDEGLEKEAKYCLVSLVCRFRWRHVCFGLDKTTKRWFLDENSINKFRGNWERLVIMCQRRNFQPRILFFEAVF